MNTARPGAFQGFTAEGLRLLHNVRWRNSKPWFEANRPVYQDHLLVPFQQLVAALSGTMLSIDQKFEVRPAINKTISRIYRDTRFSRDKSLYRDTMWLTFKRPIREWQDAPAFFFELSPAGYRYGMGFYQARRGTMDRFRERIVADPKRFLAATRFYRRSERLGLHGEIYKRRLPGDHSPAIEDWYQRKSWYLSFGNGIDPTVQSTALVGRLSDDFLEMKPLYRFVCDDQ